MKQFKDFGKPYVKLNGSKLKMKEVLYKPIEITNGKITKSKYANESSSQCLTLEFCFAGKFEQHVVFTGSSVLIEQFEKYGEQVPFQTTIVSTESCYTFT